MTVALGSRIEGLDDHEVMEPQLGVLGVLLS